MAERKPLIFSAFNMLAPSHHDHGQWARDDSRQLEYTTPGYWVDVAQTLERARFDLLFFADVLAPYELHGGSRDAALRTGLQAPVLDAASIIALLAFHTEHLGYAFTENVLQEPPYSFARRASTLDHLTGGRVGWNIVTGSIPGTGRNLGCGGLPEHADRYARAEEFLEVVYKLWEQSWEDDAVVRDRVAGIYADPDRIHSIDHTGHFYDVPGAHASEPSPQRTPVLFNAGASDRFARFAADHAEGVFSSIEVGDPSENITRLRKAAADVGRDPSSLKIISKFAYVLGSTEAEARRLDTELAETRSVESLLIKLSEGAHKDLSVLGHQEKISDILDRTTPDDLGSFHARLQAAPDTGWTLEAFVRWTGQQHTVGTPDQIADAIEHWADLGIDGLNVHYLTQPGSWEDFADHLTPELTRRGLMRAAYDPPGTTLRERLFGAGPRLAPTHPSRRSPLLPHQKARP
ncbi:NtaA/DmoA family FMN-dependent monooxygenase [Aeromicrobium sp. P5_D10]